MRVEELMNQLAHTVDLLGWLGFLGSPIVMFGGMATAVFARQKAIISSHSMFTVAGIAALASGYVAGRIIYTEIAKVFFVSLAVATASFFGFFLAVQHPQLHVKGETDVAQQRGTPRDHARFHAGLVSVGVAYAGLWCTVPTQGHPEFATNSWPGTVLIVLAATMMWTVIGLHWIVGRMVRARDTNLLGKCHLVMAISASPAVLGLAASRLTGTRWAGFLLVLLSLILLWLQISRLEKACPQVQTEKRPG